MFTGACSVVQRGGRYLPLGHLLFGASHRRRLSSVSSLIACPQCCTNLGHPQTRQHPGLPRSTFLLSCTLGGGEWWVSDDVNISSICYEKAWEGRFSWAGLAMAVKAGFLPPLKDRGRFSNSGQVFYDNQGSRSRSSLQSKMLIYRRLTDHSCWEYRGTCTQPCTYSSILYIYILLFYNNMRESSGAQQKPHFWRMELMQWQITWWWLHLRLPIKLMRLMEASWVHVEMRRHRLSTIRPALYS